MRPGETVDVLIVTPLHHFADGRSITEKLNGYQFLVILVLVLLCWRVHVGNSATGIRGYSP